MTYVLLVLSISILAALVVLVGCAVSMLLNRDRELEVLTRRLDAEQRLEFATRATLKAMHDAVHRPSNT